MQVHTHTSTHTHHCTVPCSVSVWGGERTETRPRCVGADSGEGRGANCVHQCSEVCQRSLGEAEGRCTRHVQEPETGPACVCRSAGRERDTGTRNGHSVNDSGTVHELARLQSINERRFTNIIPINDMVDRSLQTCFKKIPLKFHDKAVQSNILWLN